MTPRVAGQFAPVPLDVRFFSKVHMTDSCWVWTGATINGYGVLGGGRGYYRARAHNVAYEQTVGPIPDGLELDHLCRNRACVRPDHLEPVTRAKNVRRAWAARGLGASAETREARRTAEDRMTFSCPECARTFATKLGLGLHRRRIHDAHGLPGRYNGGCRCEPCTGAIREGARETARRKGVLAREVYKARRKAQAKGHGTDARYKAGCRCDYCKRGHALYEREAKARRDQARAS